MRRCHSLLLLLFAFVVAIPGTSHALDLWPFDGGIDYELELEGIDNDARRRNLETLAEEAVDDDNPPESLAELSAVSGLMAERVRKGMESRGWHDAQVRPRVEEAAEPPIVKLTVVSGDRYRVAKSNLVWQEGSITLDKPEQFFLPRGAYAKASDINDSATKLKDAIAKDRCLLRLEVTPVLILDSVSHEAELQYRIKAGPRANFGATTITGNSTVDQSVLRKYVKWKQGECYVASKVDDTQAELVKSQLIASAEVTIPDVPDAKGEAPVTLRVTDRKHRTITAGIGYETDRGAGVTVGWEHRNLQNLAHKLRTNAVISERRYSVDGTYTIPFFLDDSQNLSLSSAISDENTDAYDSQNISALASVDRKMLDHLRVGVGGGARFSRITDASGQQTENFGLLYVPVFAEWDSRDEVLDPTKGIFARGSVSPYSDVTGQGVSFIKSQVNAQTYLTAKSVRFRPTLAVRGAVGQITGASVEDVPADLRFYSGGGGSVRGYGYQALGPQINGSPQGGTGWSEVSGELRLRFTDTIGGVAFVDAGNVYDAETPEPFAELFTSAGLGARYFSPIGPLRFDVGIPLDEVEGGDDEDYGVYISIGQAF